LSAPPLSRWQILAEEDHIRPKNPSAAAPGYSDTAVPGPHGELMTINTHKLSQVAMKLNDVRIARPMMKAIDVLSYNLHSPSRSD
jgi:hypothetical protein